MFRAKTLYINANQLIWQAILISAVSGYLLNVWQVSRNRGINFGEQIRKDAEHLLKAVK